MAKATTQSIEPLIADLANGWLKAYKLDYKLEQESLNTEIDTALNEYFSKSGGKGGNRPDAKILLQDKSLNFYPILIEYKGYKDKLVKLDANGQVENRSAKNEPILKNINAYAVNGAVHYANALLHYTSYTDIISIGMTGYKDENGNITEIHCTYDPQSKGGNSPDGRKVKGTIHWVSAEYGKRATVRLYENIVDEELGVYNEDGSLNLNPNSLTVLDNCILEPALMEAKAYDSYQFVRNGFFCADCKDSKDGQPVFNRIVSLKSSFKLPK